MTTGSPNAFEPLKDILGLDGEKASNGTTSLEQASMPSSNIQVHGHRADRGVHMRPTVDQSTNDRVEAAKLFVKGGNAGASAQMDHSFGVTGANRHAALHPQAAQQQQQQYQQQQAAMQMQMQMYSTYNAMAMYNTAAYYTQANNAQQMQMQAQMQAQGALVPYGQAQGGAMVPYGQVGFGQAAGPMQGVDAAKVVPVMQAQSSRKIEQSEYRVQRLRAEGEAVSEEDKAFKPLLEELKASIRSKQ